MSAADERERAVAMAAVDFEKALLPAERITEAWYRSQALAAVSRFAPEPQVERVAKMALSAARCCTDWYKRVAVSAWSVCALAERDRIHSAQLVVGKLLSDAAYIDHPVIKMDALALLWYGCQRLPLAIRQPVLDALLAACRAAHSWKSGRMLRDITLIVAGYDREAAQRIIDEMGDNIYKRRAQRGLDAGEWEKVRSFF